MAQTLSTTRKLTPMWSPPRRITEQLLNSYKLETLDGAPLEGLFHARRLRSFTPREGTILATEQKRFEKALTPEESSGSGAVALGGEAQAEIANKAHAEVASEDMEDLEEDYDEEDTAQDDRGFFYEEEEEGPKEDEEIGIGARVAARRRGRLHNGGGQME